MSVAALAVDVQHLDERLSVDDVESRLIEAAHRHHTEERNIAHWLLEIDRRRLFEERGFSSLGDYAMELCGIKPRKARYLVLVAKRLERLPAIRDAFDSGALSWTKAREITKVATPANEAEWLERARVLSNRELEKAVREQDGAGPGEFATMTMSMPTEVLEMWHDAYELSERMTGAELEKWQVLESALAEFLGTHLPNADENVVEETHDEQAVAAATRSSVLERDGWVCAFPGCTMRQTLDVHHITFRSRGGSDAPENLITLCRTHHSLVHREICNVTGLVGSDLTFERPRLVTEPKRLPPEEPAPLDDTPERVESDPSGNDDASWRDQDVAAIFDAPPSPPLPEPRFESYADFLSDWCERRRTHDLEMRARRRRSVNGSDGHSVEHVFHEERDT